MTTQKKIKDELELLVEEIEKKNLVAEAKPEQTSITYRVKLGKMKRAQEDLKDLYLDYRTMIQNRAAFIVVTGSSAERFTSLAIDEFGCFAANAD